MQDLQVLLGMSGGTDSSVSAVMLKEQGFCVTGVTFLFTELEEENLMHLKDAKELAKKLKIEHHVIDLRNEFNDKIIQRFIREYSEGKTPFPCAFCNPELKFAQLYDMAEKLNCDYISTGHYSKIKEDKGVKYISKGIDEEKDQSFFLWGLNNQVIQKLILPLGDFTKEEVREYAANKGLAKASKKKDSLGICFVKGKDYRKYLNDRGIRAKQGWFNDNNGNILGKHNGIINYTIGQRRGLGINLNKPLFVTDIKPECNEIVLGEYNQLYKRRIWLYGIYFADIEMIKEYQVYTVRIRYRLQDTPCKIKIQPDKTGADIDLLEPLAMVAKGQTAVFYEDDRVIGGGFIQGSE